MNLSKIPQDLPTPLDAPIYEAPFVEEEQQSDPREQFEVFWRRKWLVFAVFMVVMVAGVVYTWTRQPVYQAITKLAISTDKDTSTSSIDDSAITALMNLDKTRNTDTQIEVLKSPDLLDEAYGQIPYNARLNGFGSPTIPTWAYNIDSKPDTDIVNITCNAYTPKLAAELAYRIAVTYQNYDRDQNREATRVSLKFVQDAKKKAIDDLNLAARRLSDYKKKSGLVDADAQMTQAANQYYEYQNDLSEARTHLLASQKQMALASSQIRRIDPEIPFSNTITENPEFSQSRQLLTQLRSQLNEKSEEFADGAPEIVALKNQISEEEKHMAAVTRSILTARQNQRNPLLDKLLQDYATGAADEVAQKERIKTAQKMVGLRQRELFSFPEGQRLLAQYQSQVDILQQQVVDLTKQQNQLQIQEVSTLPYSMIVSKARPPQFPSYPNKTQNVVAFFLLGLVLGVVAALIAEKMDNRLRDPYLVDRISGLSSLSAVPETEPSDALAEGRLILGHVENNHAFLESFRLLRNNIAFSSPDRKLKVLAVTSPSKAEGKSTVSVNLAIAMAMDGKKVVLVDCDLRRPTIHNWMDVSRDIGLTTVVKGLCTMDEAIRPTNFENLDCLPSGPLPPNPTEFLNSQHTRQVVEQLRDEYDAIIIDSPPSTGLSDVQVISTVADGIILVVTLDRTLKQYLMATIRMLRQAGAPLIGTVLNRIRYERSSYGYYSYYYYYSSYEEDAPRRKRRRKKKSHETVSKA